MLDKCSTGSFFQLGPVVIHALLPYQDGRYSSTAFQNINCKSQQFEARKTPPNYAPFEEYIMTGQMHC